MSKAAPTKVIVPTSAFSDRWSEKPSYPVEMGLRLLPSGVSETARAEAAKRAWEMHPLKDDEEPRLECYYDALMRWVVAKCTCKVASISDAYFDTAEETVYDALTDDGVRFIYDAYERFVIANSPLEQAATDEEVAELASLVAAGHLDRMMDSQALRARRLLGFVLRELKLVAR